MDLSWLIGINIDVPIWLILILGLLVSYYMYMTWHNGIFKKLGIPGPKPTPILGTLRGTFKGGFGGHDRELIAKYGDIVGAFMGRQPFIIIADLAIIKQIVVKQFNKFVDRLDFSFDDDMGGNMIQLVQENKWRNLRNTLSPTFTSGKLKKMSPHVNQCTDIMIKHLKKPAEDEAIIDFKDYAQAFTMDTIARTAFGMQLDSKADAANKFVVMANKSMNASLTSPIFIVLFFFRFLLPHMNKLGLSVFPKEGTTFFRDITNQIIEQRKQNPKEEYADFVELMLNAHKYKTIKDEKDDDGGDTKEGEMNGDTTHSNQGKKKPLTKDEILASSVIFFLAGYETTANTLMFAVHLLATHPDIQQRLYDDITNVLKGKEPDCADMVKIPYLEQLIDETLRMYPQAPRIDRIANQDVTINGLHIPKGMAVAIPVMSLHNNPKYWKNPEKFDPERFSPEEKASRDPYCYLPFGLGPRNCIGMRLAQMELKFVLIKLLQNYEIQACSKTQDNLRSMKMRQGPDGGVYVTLCKRHGH